MFYTFIVVSLLRRSRLAVDDNEIRREVRSAISMEEYHLFSIWSSSFMLLSQYVSNFQSDQIDSQIYPNTSSVAGDISVLNFLISFHYNW